MCFKKNSVLMSYSAIISLLTSCLMISLNSCSQTIVEESLQCTDEDVIFIVVEDLPSLANQSRLNILAHYPREALVEAVEGQVIVRHIVNKMGNTTEHEIVRSLCLSCDAEALRLAKMARYAPGIQRGEAVCVKLSMQVDFSLSDTTVRVIR